MTAAPDTRRHVSEHANCRRVFHTFPRDKILWSLPLFFSTFDREAPPNFSNLYLIRFSLVSLRLQPFVLCTFLTYPSSPLFPRFSGLPLRRVYAPFSIPNLGAFAASPPCRGADSCVLPFRQFPPHPPPPPTPQICLRREGSCLLPLARPSSPRIEDEGAFRSRAFFSQSPFSFASPPGTSRARERLSIFLPPLLESSRACY